MQTFIDLPPAIATAAEHILSRGDIRALQQNSRKLHERYMDEAKGEFRSYIHGPADALAYLGLRFPATYAQIYSALFQVHERAPDWKPMSVLDLGCGPGTGIWAATAIWPTIQTAVGLDQDKNLLSLAEEIRHGVGNKVTWITSTIAHWIHTLEAYDLIIVANVLNELPKGIKDDLFDALKKNCRGIVLMLEPGTPRGFGIIQSAAEKVSPLIAPYIQNTFIKSDEYWIHFPQRFTRPEFQRRIRQSMRQSNLMASDWEETKFSYVAWGTVPVTKTFWGQAVGNVQKYRGYLTLPVLTAEGIKTARVMKRHKAAYAAAKRIRWGELIEQPMELV